MDILKNKTAQYVIGAAVVLLLLYFAFRDPVDSAVITATGYDFDTDPASLDANKVLKKGDRGGNVSELQRRMLDDGADLGEYGPARDGVDGVFGKTTERELMRLKGVNAISLNTYGTMVNLSAPMTDINDLINPDNQNTGIAGGINLAG